MSKLVVDGILSGNSNYLVGLVAVQKSNEKPALLHNPCKNQSDHESDHTIKKACNEIATSLYLLGSPGRARTADLMINSHPLYRLSYRGIIFFSFGAPGEIRTPDRSVRSRVLYPAELQAPC